MERAPIADAKHAAAYIRVGGAVFTLRSKSTGVHYTYRVQEPLSVLPDGEGRGNRFVSVLTGPDHYEFLGTIFQGGRFRRSDKSKLGPDAPSAVAFGWAWTRLVRGEMPEALEVWHEGRCGRCGRALTDPESLASGFGPVCRDSV